MQLPSQFNMIIILKQVARFQAMPSLAAACATQSAAWILGGVWNKFKFEWSAQNFALGQQLLATQKQDGRAPQKQDQSRWSRAQNSRLAIDEALPPRLHFNWGWVETGWSS